MDLIILLFIAVLATFAGAELIGNIPPQLHTPLMSGSNAISGIAIVGAILSTQATKTLNYEWWFGYQLYQWLGLIAVIFATINVMGGFMVTDRMLKMFKKHRR